MVKNIVIVGVGGQGTLLTSRVLGSLTSTAGYDVKLSEVHGMAQRGGSVVTYVRYGDKVYEPIVEEGQADILIAFEQLEALRYAHYLKEDGVMIINDTKIAPMPVMLGMREYPAHIIESLRTKYRVISAEATERAIQMGNPKVFNLIILGLLASELEFTKEDWVKAIERCVPSHTLDVNLAAFEYGWQVCKL